LAETFVSLLRLSKSLTSAAMRITLVIFSLNAGGAQRVLLTMADHWARQGRFVTVITLDSETADFFPVPDGVQRVALDLAEPTKRLEVLRTSFRKIRRLRAAIHDSNPDVVVSFIDKTNLLVLLSCVGLGIRVVVSERIDPRNQPIEAPYEMLRRVLYRRAFALVVQTQSVRAWAESFMRQDKVFVIPNPIETGPHEPVGEYRLPEGPVVFAAGRLHHQKGFDLLLDAFASCTDRHPEWSLVIFGEGPERTELELRVRALGIGTKVQLPGEVKGLRSLYEHADLFVLSSRWEGFPNVLLEAMARGLPVVSTDCPSGPADMIEDGRNGLLVPPNDVGALTRAMDELMSEEGLRRRLAENARDVSQRFSVERIMRRWDELIGAVT
jgi:GalNAc-alpha-(1->4)-GalNAc-alpha-(1->3)-diNAcBac-PP-undecaprenol alpha-1,4-N-acetyl-D-galactosaminyltransferase